MMSTGDRPREASTFAERVWPVIDVYGRVRQMLSVERATQPATCDGRVAIA